MLNFRCIAGNYVWTSTGNDPKPEVMDALVFPNPATDAVSVYLSKRSDYKVSVLNIVGQQISQIKISDADQKTTWM